MTQKKKKTRIEFPKLSREQDKRYKLSEGDIGQIVKLKKLGITSQKIADRFGVSTATVCYYTNSEFRKNQMAKNAKKRTNRKQDEVYLTNLQEQRRKKGEAFLEYNRRTGRKSYFTAKVSH